MKKATFESDELDSSEDSVIGCPPPRSCQYGDELASSC